MHLSTKKFNLSTKLSTKPQPYYKHFILSLNKADNPLINTLYYYYYYLNNKKKITKKNIQKIFNKINYLILDTSKFNPYTWANEVESTQEILL